MKCQKCGKNEVNFRYSTNINGCVNETFLCSECAEKEGYNIGRLLDAQSSAGSIFPLISGQLGFTPMAMPVVGFGAPMSFRARPRIAGDSDCSGESGCGCREPAERDREDAEVDNEMKERRELRIEMRLAAEKEDFEKAAAIRDRIRELES